MKLWATQITNKLFKWQSDDNYDKIGDSNKNENAVVELESSDIPTPDMILKSGLSVVLLSS